MNFLTKYWIFVSCGTLLLVSIQNNVVIYRIIYMAFYLFFILSFQVGKKLLVVEITFFLDRFLSASGEERQLHSI